MAKLVTTTELAALLNVSRVTLHRAIKSERITVAERDARGRPLFNPAVAGKEWADWSARSAQQSRHIEGKSRGGRPGKNPPSAVVPVAAVPVTNVDGDPATDFSDFSELLRSVQDIDSPAQRILFMEAVKKAWDARNSMLRAQREDGTLVSVQQVKSDGAELGTVLVSGLQALPDRLADRLTAMKDAHAIHELLTDEINIIIGEIRFRCGRTEIDDVEEESQK